MAGRDHAGPLITFHAPGGRTFQRIFRDASLSETKDAVRRKLKLPAIEEIGLARLENERRIDLDDDDDFDAFRVATRSKATTEVAVIVGSPSFTAGPSAQLVARLSNGPSQPESSSTPACVRYYKRPRKSMQLPGNDTISSSACVPSTQVEPNGTLVSTTRADIIHSQPLSGAQSADTQHTETGHRWKKRRKLKHDSGIYDLANGRSASNPPPIYVPSTPDPLASGTGPVAVQTTSQISPTGVPTNTMNDSEASANRGSLKKKRKRKSTIEPDIAAELDPDVAVSVASSPIDFAPPPSESPVHITPRKRRNRRRYVPESPRPLTSDTSRTIALPPHVEDAPPADLPVKKRKTEKVQSEANSAQPSPEDPLDKGVQPEVKKSKSRKGKTEGRPGEMVVVQADGTQEQTTGPPPTEPVKRSKKAKHAEAMVPNARVQATSKATIVADDAPVVMETGKKKGKKKTKKTDDSATKPMEAASAAIPAAASEPIDHGKAVASAMTAIKAKRNKPSKSNMVAAGADASRSLLSQADASYAEEETSTPPEAGPSGLNVEPTTINKGKRKSKKAKVADEETQSEPATPRTGSTVAKPKDKKRKRDDLTTGVSDAATKTEVDKSDLWKAVQAASLAAMNKRLSATPAELTMAHQPPSTSVPQPDAAQEEVSEVPAKTKKPRKEKGSKSKLTVPELTVPAEKPDATLVDSVAPHSLAGTSVETQHPKRTRKSKATTVVASTTDATDHAHEYARKAPPDVTPILASATVDKPATGTHKLMAVRPRRPLEPRPTSRLLQNVLNPSPPRPPVGSDVDEVTVQERGEGSSDESSSSDEGSDEVSAPDLSQVEALLRGRVSRISVLEELPLDSEEEDSEDEKQSEASDDEEEEIRLDKEYRRMSKRFQREDSSSDEEVDEVVAATFMDVDPKETLEGQVDATDTPTVVSAAQVPVTTEGGASTSSALDDGQARKDSEEHESVLPRPGPPADATARLVSPTVSMLEEDHRKDSERDVSAQISEHDENQPSHEEESGSSKTSQEGTGARDSPSAIPPVGLDVTSVSSHLKSPPLSAIQTVIGEQPDDPIEPAEDFIIPESPRMDEIDPIEPGSPKPLPAPERQQSTPPPLPTSRPGTVRRMKNREGKAGTSRPVLASELPIAPLPVPSFAELDHEDAPVPPARKATKRTNSVTSMPPPPDPERTPTPAAEPAPKRRGRPPIPQEEKERRLAEKKAEKERLAAERKAKREADRAAKEAEKARLREEKATSKRGGRAARGSKAPKATPVVESEDEDEQPAASTNQTPNAAGQSQRPGWTALQTPQTQEGSVAEGESMMIDELRSSSPAHSSPLATGSEKTPRLSTATFEDTTKNPDDAAQPHAGNSQPQAETQTPQKVAIPGSDPLFLPGSSQVPYTPFAGTQPVAQRAASPAASTSGPSDSDSEPIAQTASLRLQRTRPWLKEGPFRRLSDLASQAMFTPPSIFSLTASAKKDVPEKGQKQEDEDEDEDSDEDEDEDEDDDEDEGQGRKSHIPENRRAGAGVQKKRASGLASFTK